MFGPDILVAPILYEGARERTLYLPGGRWISIHDGTVYDGGRKITVPAPLEIIPAFYREGTLRESGI